MAKTGRNDPCPCGSGRKYKKCCLPSHSLPAPAATAALKSPDLALMAEVEHLDELSNAVVHQLRAGRLGEAERLCQELAEQYPDEIDPLERYAMLYEARGDHATAASFYRRAAEFARTHDGFDAELIATWLADAERLEALPPHHPRRAAPHPTAPARDDGVSPPDPDEAH